MSSSEPSTAAPQPATASWEVEFHRLRTRFPRAKDSILFCVHALSNSAAISLDDLKAQAQMHGLRVTGASLTAARRQLQPRAAKADPVASVPPVARPGQQERPSRAPEPPADLELLLRQLLGRAHGDAGAEVERLKAAVRQAIAMLQAALE